MKFYDNQYWETHIKFDDNADDCYHEDVYTSYRFANPLPDYNALKKAVMEFIDEESPIGFDSVYMKEMYDIPGVGADPRIDYGQIYEEFFMGHNIKYIIVTRRLSFYWFTVEIFEDRLSKIHNDLLAPPSSPKYDMSLTDILKEYKPIMCWRIQKFK